METIHFKTVDPVSQELLREASQKGLGLNWERYEKQQPQDGFLRLGLSCPYGCLQGPCRIDPFGRGADRGVCGLDRDGMAAAFLLRLSLQGVLETIAGDPAQLKNAIKWPASLAGKAAAALEGLGGAPLSPGEVFTAAKLLARPSADPASLVRRAIRLGLLGIGLAAQGKTRKSPKSMGCRAGWGLLAGKAITIGLAGRIPAAEVKALRKEAAALKNPKVRLISLGDWIPVGTDFLPIACTTGEAETLLSSGRINLLIAGPGADPGLLALCGRMKIACLFSPVNDGAAALKRARAAFDRTAPVSFSPAASLIGERRVSIGAAEIEAALKDGASARIALIGGADTLRLSLGHLPVELAKALRGEDFAVGSWGDAALWMLKQDLPIGLLDAQNGPLAAVAALGEAGKLADIKGICFTGLRDCREIALALGLAALGLKVIIAEPLPLWGSANIRAALREELAAAGGILVHFDHPARAEEILECFLRA